MDRRVDSLCIAGEGHADGPASDAPVPPVGETGEVRPKSARTRHQPQAGWLAGGGPRLAIPDPHTHRTAHASPISCSLFQAMGVQGVSAMTRHTIPQPTAPVGSLEEGDPSGRVGGSLRPARWSAATAPPTVWGASFLGVMHRRPHWRPHATRAKLEGLAGHRDPVHVRTDIPINKIGVAVVTRLSTRSHLPRLEARVAKRNGKRRLARSHRS